MSIADKITSIEGHLTADYEGLENLGADLTNVNKNIQNIRTCLDNIYSSLPKTTGEGSNLSLSPTLKGKLNIEAYKGDTEQDTTTGINLLPLDEIAETTTNGITYSVKNGILKLNGTATAPSTIYIKTNGITLASGTYSFCGIIQSGTETGVIGKYLRNSGGNVYDGGRIESLQTRTIESYENLSATIYISSGVVCSNFVIGLMFLSGTYSSSNLPSFEPYTNGASPNPDYPQDIEVVTEEQEVVVQNANILDTSEIKVVKNQTGDNRNGYYCKINTTGTYTLILNTTNTMYFGKSTNLESATTLIGSTSATYTTNYTFNEGEYFIIWGTKTDTDKLMVALGTSLPYIAHQEQTKTLSLGDIELAEIGNYIDNIFEAVEGNSKYDSLSNETKATLTIGKWYIEKNINKVVFNGSETGWGTQNDVFCIEINDILTQSYDERSIIVLSNYFLGARTAYRGSINNLTIAKTIDNGRPKQLGIRYDAFNNVVADFKTWLSTHNTIVYYVLSTPTYTEITNESLINELNELEKMMSYSGQTNISISGNLPMILSVSALKGE